jgi:hypothetical protein
MNKEQILECFYNERVPVPAMKNYCELYDVYLTKEAQPPANFEVSKSDRPIVRSLAHSSSSLNPTQSTCPAFSKLEIDTAMYNDIMNNRKKHNIFLNLEDDDIDIKKWYYLDEEETTRGPFSSQMMNDFFLLNKIDDKIMVKDCLTDERFSPFKSVIKRYYKKITEKSGEANPQKTELKVRTMIFRKGECANLKKKRTENQNYRGRMDRVLTHEVRPSNLYFLEEAIEDPDLLDLIVVKRERAGTAS